MDVEACAIPNVSSWPHASTFSPEVSDNDAWQLVASEGDSVGILGADCHTLVSR